MFEETTSSNMTLQVKIAAILLFVSALGASKEDATRIIRSVSLGKFANVVSLQTDGKHFCGGSLISQNWILTSAQCVYDVIEKEVSAVAGIVNLNDEGQKRVVKEIVVHENFKFPFSNNIALLRIDTPFELNKNVKIVYLKESKTEEGTRAVVVGWNATSANERDNSLQAIVVKTLSDEDCKTAAHKPQPNKRICADVGDSEERGLCLNDAGEPLYDVDLSAQIGIASLASSCDYKYPFMYTSVAAYLKWIKTKTNNSVIVVDGVQNKIFNTDVIVNIDIDISDIIIGLPGKESESSESESSESESSESESSESESSESESSESIESSESESESSKSESSESESSESEITESDSESSDSESSESESESSESETSECGDSENESGEMECSENESGEMECSESEGKSESSESESSECGDSENESGEMECSESEGESKSSKSESSECGDSENESGEIECSESESESSEYGDSEI